MANKNIEEYLSQLKKDVISYKNYVRWKNRNSLLGDSTKEWLVVRSILQRSHIWRISYRRERTKIYQIFLKVKT